VGDAFTIWLHLFAVSVWIGPQVFLFAAAIPAVREIEEGPLRARVTRRLVTRFGYLAWGALLVIVLTGVSNLLQRAADFDHVLDPGYRYFHIFTGKMFVLGFVVAMTAVHTFIVGPRQLQFAEAEQSNTEEAQRLRRSSIMLSSMILLGSLIVLFLGALLGTHAYSFQPT
jgi:uncharacterized membrane protein